MEGFTVTTPDKLIRQGNATTHDRCLWTLCERNRNKGLALKGKWIKTALQGPLTQAWKTIVSPPSVSKNQMFVYGFMELKEMG